MYTQSYNMKQSFLLCFVITSRRIKKTTFFSIFPCNYFYIVAVKILFIEVESV